MRSAETARSTLGTRRTSCWSTALAPSLLTAPVVLLLTVAILAPSLWTIYLSLNRYSFGYPMEFAGLGNYGTILRDADFWNALRNTLIFVVATVGGEFLLGLGAALLLSRRFAGQNLWIALLISPYAASPVVSVVVWKYMLDHTVGVVNYGLSWLGIGPYNWLTSPLHAFIAVVGISVWMSFPFTMLLLYAAVEAIPRELFEAASVDGASGWDRFRFITFPLMIPAAVVALTFRTILALRTFDIIWILTRGGPVVATEVLAIYLYRHGFSYWNFGMGAAIAWLILIVTMAFVMVYLRMMLRPARGL